jgi:hypothetical protein
VIEILEHATVKVLGVVDCDLLRKSIAANNVLPEKFMYGCRGHIGDRIHLDPLDEIFYRYYVESVIFLCCVSLLIISMPHSCNSQDGAISCEGWAGDFDW